MKKISAGFILILIFNIVMIVIIVDATIDINKLRLINPARVRMAEAPYIFLKYLMISVNILYFVPILINRLKRKLGKVEKVNMAEKLESSPLKFFFRIFKALALTVLILYVLLLSRCIYHINRQASDGLAWCESVINEYEEGWDEFLEKHSDRLHDGFLLIHPSPEYKHARANFIVESNGEYKCRYSHGGGFFPVDYEYTSKTQEWINTD